MTSDFWPTLAEISATFIGLIFVGIAIFVESIRKATKEMESIINVKTDFKEQSTPLSYVLTISNLILFVWPMIIALYLSEVSDEPFVYWLCLLLCCSLVITLIILYEWKIHDNISLVNSEKTISFFKTRLNFRFILYIIGGLICIAFANIHFRFLDVTIAIIVQKCLNIFSIILGLGLSLFDILIFDVKHTLFELPDDFPSHISKATVQLNSKKTRIDAIFEEYERSIEEVDPLIYDCIKNNTSDINNKMVDILKSDQKEIFNQHDFINQQFCSDGISFLNGIGTHTKVMTYEDIMKFIRQRKILESSITDMEAFIEKSKENIQEFNLRFNK